ncbi:hypothetical protein HPB51_002163 [Rhipicephalus microplus]|uniref:SHSP domain-containing protein n=1 Tax=Rhipicephalus microplus TaxID=6941 RepID=A0A9J6EKV7_RHIMP|nr:hypothetical protein HPB51_002163 [Rhipicephalus microplus]
MTNQSHNGALGFLPAIYRRGELVLSPESPGPSKHLGAFGAASSGEQEEAGIRGPQFKLRLYSWRLTVGCRRKRPLSEEESSRSAVDSTADDDSKFVVNCNVRGYKPEEISVKAIGDCVEVSAKHEEDSEDGSSYVKREFTQRFTLPEGVKAETVTCALSSSGVLAIEAPKPEVPSKKPRMIPITVESSKPIEAASEANKKAEKQEEGAPEAALES